MLRLTKSQLEKMFGQGRCHDLGTKQLKYRNKKCEWAGKVFDSIHERDRYLYLQERERCGVIYDLRMQVPFELIPKRVENGKVVERACVYVADFVYRDQLGKVVVEDAKSKATRKNPTYVIKRKLMLEKYGIKIVEV